MKRIEPSILFLTGVGVKTVFNLSFSVTWNDK